jgi:hypothetical protein
MPTEGPLSLDAEDEAPRSATGGELTVGAVPPGGAATGASAGDDVKTDPGVGSGTACGANMGDDVQTGVTTTVVLVVGLGVDVVTVGESVGTRKLEGDAAGGVGTGADGTAAVPPI